MIFDKRAKTIQWGKEQAFQQMVLGQLDIHLEENKVGPLSHTMKSKAQKKTLKKNLDSIKIKTTLNTRI